MTPLRQLARALRKSPGFTAAAVISLALGIGANTALFSVSAGLLLRPLPYRIPGAWPSSGIDRRAWASPKTGSPPRSTSISGRAQTAFSDVAIAIGAYATLTGRGEPERVGALRVSSNLLPMLGARPAPGRLFAAGGRIPGRTGSAVLAHGAWVRRFGGDPAVVGRTLTLNGEPYEIVGVLPAGFTLPRDGASHARRAWRTATCSLPLPLAPAAADVRIAEDYNILARLRPGVTLQPRPGRARRAHRRGCAAIIRKSIRPTAA